LLALLMGWPGHASAGGDRQRASRLLRKGNELHDSGRYAEALATYREAYALYPSHKLHYNCALTYEAMGLHVQAARSIERFLARAGGSTPAKILKRATSLRRRLWRRLGAVEVRCSLPGAEVALDGRRQGVTPLSQRIFARPGPRRLSVTLEGYRDFVLDMQIRPGRSEVVDVQLQPASRQHLATEGWGRRHWAYTTAGAGGAVLLTSLILYGVGGSKGSAAHDRYQQAADAEEFKKQREAVLDARDMLAAGHVLLGAALVAGGVATYLLLTDEQPAPVQVGIAPTPSGGGVSLGIPFGRRP